RADEHRGRVAPLPRADPAGDHVRHERRRAGDRAPVRPPTQGRVTMSESTSSMPPLAPEPQFSLKATGRSRRRLGMHRGAEILATVAALFAVAVLAVLVGSVLARAFDALDWNLITKGPAVFGQTGGGIAPAIVGTLMLVLIATAIALPVGTLIAIYVSE